MKYFCRYLAHLSFTGVTRSSYLSYHANSALFPLCLTSGPHSCSVLGAAARRPQLCTNNPTEAHYLFQFENILYVGSLQDHAQSFQLQAAPMTRSYSSKCAAQNPCPCTLCSSIPALQPGSHMHVDFSAFHNRLSLFAF